MSIPPYKAEYDPLYKAMRKLKKTSQIKSLSMGPPMGAIPPGVDVELAKEFTGTFCAALIAEFKGGDLAKKVSMKKFKARVKELREKAGVTAPLKAKKKEAAASKKEAATPKKEEEKKKEPKEKSGPFEDFKKKFAEEDMPEHIVKELYDHTQNAYSMLTKKSDLSLGLHHHDLVDFYGNFNDKLSEEDAKYIMQYLTQGESEKLCEFVDFADAMYSNLGRKEVFGYMFDMCTWYYSRAWIFSQCTKGEEMTLDELRGMLKQLGEDEKNERTLFTIHEKCKKRDAFIKFWSETLTDIVAPKAAPPIPKSNAGPSKSSGSSSSSSSSGSKTATKSAPSKSSGGGGGGGGGGGAGDAMKKDPKYAKYFKMVKMHLPKQAAINKMTQDGLSGDVIKQLSALL